MEQLSPGQMDLVATEMGQSWRQLCRALGLSDSECEQLEYDHHLAGLYEVGDHITEIH